MDMTQDMMGFIAYPFPHLRSPSPEREGVQFALATRVFF